MKKTSLRALFVFFCALWVPHVSGQTTHRLWLEEVAPLITAREKEVFLQLQGEGAREAFRMGFWQARDPTPTEPGNPARELFHRHVQFAWGSLGSLEDPRAQMVILQGPPRYVYSVGCSVFHPLQLFFYPRRSGEETALTALFFRETETSPGDRLWSPSQGLAELIANPKLRRETADVVLEKAEAVGCFAGQETLQGFLAGALDRATNWTAAKARSKFHFPEDDWLDSFQEPSDEVRTSRRARPPKVSFPAKAGGRTVLQGRWDLPADILDTSQDRWVLHGDLIPRPGQVEDQQDGASKTGNRPEPMRDRFRQAIPLGERPKPGEDLPVYFYRDLTAGRYDLWLRLEDAEGRWRLRGQAEVVVPEEVVPEEVPAIADEVASGGVELMPQNLTLFAGRPSLEIVPPPGLQVGPTPVAVQTTGFGIAQVRYALDGDPVVVVDRSPWNATVDLGAEPRAQTLAAVALDREGRELARDEVTVNVGAQHFGVRLLSPRTGERPGRTFWMRAAVEMPPGAVLDRVEFFLGDTLSGTLYQRPFVHRATLEQQGTPTFVRVVASLADGSVEDDVAVVHVTGPVEEIEVREVQLLASVSDRRGRPLRDLRSDEFQVFEEGVEQEILRLDLREDLPFHAGLLIDSSLSMVEELPLAIDSSLEFFSTVLTSEDQATVVAFDHRTRLAVPFTRDLAWLRDGVSMLSANGGTALWDSLAGTLHYFGGLDGKRALVLLSDGEDQHSRFSFEQALDMARRSGVALYPIFLQVDRERLDPSELPSLERRDASLASAPDRRLQRIFQARHREKLRQLAEATGGLLFGIGNARGLKKVFEEIEKDLRTQVLLTYQSSHQGEGFREVELRMKRPRVQIRTSGGYYP